MIAADVDVFCVVTGMIHLAVGAALHYVKVKLDTLYVATPNRLMLPAWLYGIDAPVIRMNHQPHHLAHH